MSFMNPFRPQAAGTESVAVSTTPLTAFQVSSAGNFYNMMATWIGSIPCYVEFSTTGVTATLPSSSAKGSFPLLPNVQQSLTVPPNCYVSAITSAAAGGTLLLTPGDGF